MTEEKKYDVQKFAENIFHQALSRTEIKKVIESEIRKQVREMVKKNMYQIFVLGDNEQEQSLIEILSSGGWTK
jgi:hypothetical protein